jgi:exonuclease SbcC
MLPLKLKIAGLYSYIEEQIIDFTELSNAGLFGIFGEIGSGKSSILDAICFAIYEKTERLNISGDNRYYNMLNLNCNAATVEFQFQAGKNKSLYEIYFRLKRAPRTFESVEKEFHLYYQIVDGEKVTITSKEIQESIGLSYENFRRTIIIPQGKFKDFIELKGTDRSKMMKELFNLHRFDLSFHVKTLEGNSKETRDKIEGELTVYHEINQELIETLQNELKELNEKFNQLDQELNTQTSILTQLEDLKEKHTTLKSKQEELFLAQEQAKQDDEKEKEIEIYSKLKANFSNLFSEIDLLSKDLSLLTQNVNQLNEEQKQRQLLKNDNDNKLQLIAPELEKLEINKDKITDYENCIKIKKEEIKLQSEIEKKTLLANQFIQINTSQEEKNTLKLNINNEIKELEKDLITESVLENIKFWFFQIDEKERFCQSINRQKNEIQKQIHQVDNELASFYNSELNTEFDSLETDFNAIQFNQVITSVLNNKNSQLIALRDELNHLKVQEQLVRFSENLKSGSPCDLCGSTDHPNPLTADFSGHKIIEMQQELTMLESKINELNSLNLKMMTGFTNKENYAQQLVSLDSNLKTNLEEKQVFETNCPSKDFKASDSERFNVFYKEAKVKNEDVKRKNKEIENITNELNTLQENKSNLSSEISACDSQLASLEATINVYKQNIKHLPNTIYSTLNISELNQEKDELANSIASLEQKNILLNQTKQNLDIQLAEIGANLLAKSENVDQLKNRLTEKENELSNKLSDITLSKDEIKSIISNEIDEVSIRESINNNRNKLNAIKGAIKLLETQIDGKIFDPIDFENKKSHLNEITQSFRTISEKKAQKEEKLIHSRQALIQKTTLEKQFNQLTIRLNDLKTLKSLFSSNGFVDFMSIRYLHNIIELANVRFQKMTKQHYKLVLYGKDNELYIEDFLNGGKKRSLKSLGGGHTFQACLALALALSENIQKMASIDQQFFFLDEGFGTLDKNALQLVFETLKSLKNENRVVGLISHVEELQQEMDVFLKISQNQEVGTIITESWK